MRGNIGTLALLIVFLAGMAPSFAQDVPVVPAIGLKAGVNLSRFEVEGSSTSNRPGFVGGAYARFPMGPMWSFELDMLYAQKGFTKSSYESGTETITGWEVKTSYLEFPLTARVDIPTADVHPYIFGGFSAGVMLGAEQKHSGTMDQWEDISDELVSINWTMVFGLGLAWNHFQLEGRFNHGLTDLGKEQFRATMEDRTFSFTLGYDIFK